MKLTFHHIIFVFTTLALLLTHHTQSQHLKRFNSFRYSVNEGLLQSTITDLAIDGNNIWWISFPNGIQKFDGKAFYTIPVQEHLPDDKFVLFLTCNNGDVLFSHSKGISRYNVQQDYFTTLYTFNQTQKIPPRLLGEANQIVYIYMEDGTLNGIDVTQKKLVRSKPGLLPPFQGNIQHPIPWASRKIISNNTTFLHGNDVYQLNIRDFSMDKISLPYYISRNTLEMLTQDAWIIASNQNVNPLKIINIKTQSIQSPTIRGIAPILPEFSLLHRLKSDALIYIDDNRIFQLDKNLSIVTHEWVNFQNKPILVNTGLRFIREDRFGNIILATMREGIIKIVTNHLPVKYYGLPASSGNHILSVYPDKKRNRVLAGTSGHGLLIFDTLQHLTKHLYSSPGKKEGLYINAITETPQGDYLLFTTHKNEAYWLSGQLNELKHIPIDLPTGSSAHNPGYFGNFLYRDAHRALIQSQGTLYKVQMNPLKITEHFFTDFYAMSGICINDQFVYHVNDTLHFCDTLNFTVKRKQSLPHTGYVRCFLLDKNSNLYIGSNKGVFKTDTTGKIIWHMDKNDGLPDECIYAMLYDNNGNIWCSSNKGVFRIGKDKSILQLKKEDGLQENEFNTNVAAMSADGELFWGGVNGVSSFYPDQLGITEEKVRLFITGIRVNNRPLETDSALWNITRLKLNHDQKSLSFDFLAMGPGNPDQYIYQYKMEGVDDQWIQNDGNQTIRYFLSPGKYRLKLYASRFFNKDAVPLKEIKITIDPPFWKTWWFILSVSTLLLTLLIFSINRYNRQKYLGKLQQFENERKIQQERERISRDLHDNIGAFANAVLHKAEMLQLQKEEPIRKHIMEDLKTASKEIIVSLRETIWAFKQATYTSEDCMLRIKNFVQSLTRYYPQIHFSINDHSPSEFTLHNTHALNLVRIIQESITNSVKHAHAKHISIHSFSENNIWTVTVSDDGVGFDEQIVQHGDGLDNMKKRAAESEFEFDILSNPETGTTSTLRVLIKSR